MESRVLEIIERGDGVRSFRFDGWMDYEPGQFFFVTIEGDKTKHFSFSSSPTEDHIEFTKKLTDSDYSGALRRLKTGDRVQLEGPKGEFTMDEGRKMAILTGGIGITPFRSMLRYIIDEGLDKDVVMLYSNKTPGDIPFKEELDSMGERENIEVKHVITRDDSWNGLKGHIDSDMIKENIDDWKQRTFYTAGPPKMVETMEKILKEMKMGKIRKENFPGY
jgi:ferredoxin-NADP reductase